MPESTHVSSNAAQIEAWNTTVGRTWVEFQDHLDRQVQPLGLAAMRALAPSAGEHLLDIGCGCGQSTVQLAERVGKDGAVMGVDVSLPMLEVARRRPAPVGAARVVFHHCDAQVDALGTMQFDGAFSRFGVMFFAEPVLAFKNITHALKPGGRLAFVCWRPLQENPWLRVPLEAARPYLPASAAADPDAPGPFAFADAARVRSLLVSAGFSAVTAEPLDMLLGGADLEATLTLNLRMGPLGAALRESPEVLPLVVGPVREALRHHLTDQGVRIGGAWWVMTARKAADHK